MNYSDAAECIDLENCLVIPEKHNLIFHNWNEKWILNFQTEIVQVQQQLREYRSQFEQVELKFNDFDFNKEMMQVLDSPEVFRNKSLLFHRIGTINISVYFIGHGLFAVLEPVQQTNRKCLWAFYSHRECLRTRSVRVCQTEEPQV